MVNLTDEELIILDGKCREAVQTLVDGAKARLQAIQTYTTLPPNVAKFIANLAQAAKERGKLVFEHTKMRTCPVCEKSAGYGTYARNGRHHRKGEQDYSKPLYLYGYEFLDNFIRMEGHPALGMCGKCWEVHGEAVGKVLREIKAAIPQAISGIPPRWKYYPNEECSKCGWQGHEGEIKKLPALMGGYYPGKCPQCGAESVLFGPLIFKRREGFTLVETEQGEK